REFVPSPAQGAIALETRCDTGAQDACRPLDHPDTRVAVTAERALLAALGGGCLLPLGAWARIEDGRLVLTAALAGDRGIVRAELAGDTAAPEALGRAVAGRLG